MPFDSIAPSFREKVMKRIGQRNIIPTGIRRRQQPIGEREVTATVALPGEVGDFSDIQKAINAVRDIGGGTVFIKAGTYTIIFNLNLYSDIRLIGESSDLVTINLNFSTLIVNIAGTEGAEVNNVQITGIKIINHVPEAVGYALNINYAENCLVSDCYFYNNNASEDYSVSVGVRNSNHITIENNRFEPPGDYAVTVENTSSYVYVIRNKILGDFDANHISVGSSYSWVKENISLASTNTTFISFTGSHGIISDNIAKAMDSSGILVYGDYNVVDGNVLESSNDTNYGSGIGLTGASNNVVSNNTIKEIDKYVPEVYGTGIMIKEDSDDVSSDENVIIGNVIKNCQRGIRLLVSDATPDRNIIVGNIILNSIDAAIKDDGSSNTELGHNITV